MVFKIITTACVSDWTQSDCTYISHRKINKSFSANKMEVHLIQQVVQIIILLQFHALCISICVIQALERNKMATHQCPEEEKIKQYCIFCFYK